MLAPLLFWCAERTFFHGHLACFDVPICALWAGVGVAWLDALREKSRASGLWLSFVYGVSLAVKHNAWFLPPVLLVHALLLPGAQRKSALLRLPWLLLSPVVLFLAWPLLWHDPLRHLGDWIAFHTHHVHYAWWYFGEVLRAPPFPVVYPLVVDALALPLTTVALLAAAGISLLLGFAFRRLDAQRLLELGLAGAALLPFLLTHHADLRRAQALARDFSPCLRRRRRRSWSASRPFAQAARGGGRGGAAAGPLADRARAPVRHQRLRGAGGRHPRRGHAGHAAAILVEQRDRGLALARTRTARPTRASTSTR